MDTRQNRLAEVVLTSTHNLCFELKYENYQNFLSESFHFLVVKFSIYLNRRVFVIAVQTGLGLHHSYMPLEPFYQSEVKMVFIIPFYFQG